MFKRPWSTYVNTNRVKSQPEEEANRVHLPRLVYCLEHDRAAFRQESWAFHLCALGDLYHVGVANPTVVRVRAIIVLLLIF